MDVGDVGTEVFMDIGTLNLPAKKDAKIPNTTDTNFQRIDRTTPQNKAPDTFQRRGPSLATIENFCASA